MAKIVHVIQQVSRGGGCRATIYLAKYSAQLAGHDHSILSLESPDIEAVRVAAENNVRIISGLSAHEIDKLFSETDVVQFSWWNNHAVQRFMRTISVPIRSVGWFHVGGAASPQVITPKLVDYFDYAVACSPYTYQAAAIQSLSEVERSARTGLVYGATDFARIDGFTRKPHEGFTVGYIGTLDFLKMHRNYVSMSVGAQIPEARFIFCGSGVARDTIRVEAAALGAGHQFQDLGYVDNIRSMLEILDVYGYPLCPETYAASEMNLQEVMYAGIPPVVFPYGGVKELITHNQTGLIVHSEEEYSHALRYLYERPDERARIGANAHEYAKKVFGAHNAGQEINKIYEKVLNLPKRVHTWGGTLEEKMKGRVRPLPGDLFASLLSPGAELFLDSLGFHSLPFLQSLFGCDDRERLLADAEIMNSSTVLIHSGLTPYKDAYREDSYLHYWLGVAHLGSGSYELSLLSFLEAIKNIQDWRVFLYLLLGARKLGHVEIQNGAIEALEKLMTPERRELISEFFPDAL